MFNNFATRYNEYLSCQLDTLNLLWTIFLPNALKTYLWSQIV